MLQVVSDVASNSMGERAEPPPRDPWFCDTPGRGIALEQAVAHVFGVPSEDILNTTRGKASSARARQVIMYLHHVAFGLTLTEVGSRYNRDRTTVAHACGLVEDQRDDPAFDRALDLLELVARAVDTPRFDDSSDT